MPTVSPGAKTPTIAPTMALSATIPRTMAPTTDVQVATVATVAVDRCSVDTVATVDTVVTGVQWSGRR